MDVGNGAFQGCVGVVLSGGGLIGQTADNTGRLWAPFKNPLPSTAGVAGEGWSHHPHGEKRGDKRRRGQKKGERDRAKCLQVAQRAQVASLTALRDDQIDRVQPRSRRASRTATGNRLFYFSPSEEPHTASGIHEEANLHAKSPPFRVHPSVQSSEGRHHRRSAPGTGPSHRSTGLQRAWQSAILTQTWYHWAHTHATQNLSNVPSHSLIGWTGRKGAGKLDHRRFGTNESLASLLHCTREMPWITKQSLTTRA
jgi:hypothetical protein